MPEYGAEIKLDEMGGEAFLSYPKLINLKRWLKKNVGYWVSVKIKLHKVKDKKTKEQLGYYWGLLLPEIHQELLSRGITVPIRLFNDFETHIDIPKDAVHEALTATCGRIGEGGEGMRLSQMDKYKTTKFVDNVLNVAVDLEMNMKELEAIRPEVERN